MSVSVESFGTGKIPDERIQHLIAEHFDLRPAAIIEALDLRRPIYRQTAAYGHFGRPDLDLPWERTDRRRAPGRRRRARLPGARSPRRSEPGVYAVILAGGGGTRLWPLSSPERPKPFLPLLGERTLLQLTADRLDGVVDAEFDLRRRPIGATKHSFAEQLPDATILAEPVGRNTAAAIALATVAIDRPEDEVMLVLPADQTIEDAAAFLEASSRDAERELALGSLVCATRS